MCRPGRGLRGDVRVPVVREGGVLPSSRVCDRVSAVRHGASCCLGQVLPRASRRVLLLLLRVVSMLPARMLLLRIGAIRGGVVVRVPWRQRRLWRGRRRQLAELGVRRRGVRAELLLRVSVQTRARVLGRVRSTRTRLRARAVRVSGGLRLRSTEQLVVRLLLPRAGRRGRHRKAASDKQERARARPLGTRCCARRGEERGEDQSRVPFGAFDVTPPLAL